MFKSGNLMLLDKSDYAKYGCPLCADVRKGYISQPGGAKLLIGYCNHGECPYAEEIDEYESYGEYERFMEAKFHTFMESIKD